MEKKKMAFTIPSDLSWDEEKLQFSGFLNGEYVTMKQSENGKWYITAWKDVTFFEPKPKY